MVSNPYSATAEEQSPANEVGLGTIEGDLYLRFYVPSGAEFALPAIGIREVLQFPPDRINIMPNVSPLLLGTINVRGRVVWVGDLGQFLGDPTPVSSNTDISIIAIEDQDMVLGLAIERIGGMAWLKSNQLQSPRSVPESAAPFVKGEWLLEDGSSLKLLDQTSILTASRWVN